MAVCSAHVLCALIFIAGATAKNILFLAGLPSPSHHIWNRELTNGLAARGYNVTVLSTDIDKVPPPNVHYIILEDNYGKLYGDIVISFLESAQMQLPNPFTTTIKTHEFMFDLCKCKLDCAEIMNSRKLIATIARTC